MDRTLAWIIVPGMEATIPLVFVLPYALVFWLVYVWAFLHEF